MSYLDKLIELKLSGDRSRILELFQSDSDFYELVRNGKSNDWLNFEIKTFDGEYLIKTHDGYECYQQERGIKFGVTKHESLLEAAKFTFQSEL
ncbi:hypothetical protein ACWU4D_16230 [Vibrio sp. WJH972]